MSNIYPINMLCVETPSGHGYPPEQFQDHQPLPALCFFFPNRHGVRSTYQARQVMVLVLRERYGISRIPSLFMIYYIKLAKMIQLTYPLACWDGFYPTRRMVLWLNFCSPPCVSVSISVDVVALVW